MPEMELNGPGSRETLNEAAARLGVRFPSDYVDFMIAAGGGVGAIGDEGYLVLWRAKGARVDGGDVAYAFDTHADREAAIVEVPFIPLRTDEARPIGSTFAKFLGSFHG